MLSNITSLYSKNEIFDPSTIANKILFIGEDCEDSFDCKHCDEVV
jgi:hypothetical protein